MTISRVAPVFVLCLFPAAAFAQVVEPAIAFGARHALALRTNGDVLSWGENVGCQLGRRAGNRDATPAIVMRNAKEIAAASDHSLVLTTDGKVYGWGTNPDGALGAGNTHDQCEGPLLIPSLADKTIAHIATGVGFSVALTTTGELYCAGDNSMGQCAAGRSGRLEAFVAMPVPDLAGRVVAIKAGGFHTLLLTSNGTLHAVGRGRDGQLGHGKTVNGAGAVSELTDVVSFDAGMWHSVAARADGSVWAWGNNGRSQLCDGTTANRAVPARVALPGAAKVPHVAAGGHGTMMKTSEGAVYVCGDNQFGALGVTPQPVVPLPVLVPGAAGASPVLAVNGLAGAIGADRCSARMAGDNSHGLVALGDAPASRTFAARAGLSLCGPAAGTALPNLLREPPRGGASGCWTPRKEEDAASSPRFAGLRQAMVAAEDLLRQNAAFRAAPEPVRLRTSMSAGPSDDGGARMHVKVVPERKNDGTRVWTGECDVIPQIDRIGGAIFQVSVFFNPDPRTLFITATGTGPKLTGTVAGHPEYNGWVLITKDGRLPWLPQTLADKLDAEGARRQRALADWNRTVAGMKPADPAKLQSAYELIKKTDPAGAEKMLAATREQAVEVERLRQQVYPATTAQFQKQIADYEKYRASFTPEQLRAPGVWGDPSGDGKRKLEAETAALRALTAEEQRQVDEWTREARRAPAQAAEFTAKVRELRRIHAEKAAPFIADALARYELTNLVPGPADRAISYKPDPSFPDVTTPNRIQVIAISFSQDPDPKQTVRRAWQQRAKETFDYAALGRLIK